MNIHYALKHARTVRSMRQGDVAEKAGISQTYLSQIETGGKVPSMEVIETLCKVYNRPLPILLWFAMEKSDIPKKKHRAYDELKPVVDRLISSLI